MPSNTAKRLNKDHKNFTLKVYRGKKKVDTIHTHKLRRFSNHIQAIDFSQSGTKAYIRVYSGRFIDNRGKMNDFYNDGEYFNKKDLLKAYKAFIE